ncbi:MAG: hypothetical protein ACE364_06620 [Chlorobiota bacterium]
MKKITSLIIVSIMMIAGATYTSNAQASGDYDYVDSLMTIDYELRKMFPRWKVCEPDLQFQIYQAFSIYGYSKDELNIEEIEVLASPKPPRERTYEILLLSCGDATMNPQEIDQNIKTISKYLSGDKNYNRFERPTPGADPRTYCYIEVPPEVPVKPSEATAIQDYLKPEDKIQAFTLSLFEQTLKVGETGFWINNKVGTDEVGYQFWSSGESKITLQRPLMNNTDPETREYVPRLINAYLGGAYRHSSGIDNEGTAFSWVSNRTLNSGPDGKIVAGFDVHMPFHPSFGVGLNLELPFSDLRTESVAPGDYGTYANTEANFTDGRGGNGDVNVLGIAPLLRETGQATLFYNWWLGEDNTPSHYFRFDVGASYAQVDEYLMYEENFSYTLERNGVAGLQSYKPDTFGDWFYFRAQYRNQQAFPFSLSAQISNQILLAQAYMPIFGNWFLLEGKFSTILRDEIRPYEIQNFFMISPILRITI